MKNISSSTPVYMTIYQELRDKIVNTELLPGAILPSENDLCTQYSASRETVRKGLKELEQEGLIYSRPRRGYFVCSPRHDQLTLSLSHNLLDSESRFKDIKIIHPGTEIRESLKLSSSDKVIAVYRGNYDKEQLLGIEVKYIPYRRGIPTVENEINFAVFPEAADAKADSFSYYTQMQITATTAPQDILALMGQEKEEPLLLVTKTYISQSGSRIGFSKHYLRTPYVTLNGTSGYMQKNKKAE